MTQEQIVQRINPIIAETMKVLGYVNRFSRGVSRVNEELLENGNGKAFFNFDLMTVFEVTINLSEDDHLQVPPPTSHPSSRCVN